MTYQPITSADIDAVMAAVRIFGPNRARVAEKLDIDYGRLDRIIRKANKEWQAAKKEHAAEHKHLDEAYRNANRDFYSSTFADLEAGPLDVPVRPFPFTRRQPANARKGKFLSAVLYGDSQVPYHDPRALDIVLRVIADVNPNVVVHMGDLVDCYTISDFSKNPKRVLTLQDEIDEAREWLALQVHTAPDAEHYLLEGNHEDRLRRLLWKLPDVTRQLMSLRAVEHVTTWPVLFDLESLGIKWVPTHLQSRTPILPKMILKHGTIVRKWSGWTAKGEWERYGKSGASGHTHRKGVFYHRDHNGNHFWIETGCTCSLDQDYAVDPDWQQGCVVLHIHQETGAYHIEDVYIHEGTAVWRDRMLEAAGCWRRYE